MLKGQDQTDARDFNMKAIVSYLRVSPLSCSELATKTGLSKPALTKITAEMQALGLLAIVKRDEKEQEFALGRKPVFFTVNPLCGCVAAVDFSTVNITIRLCDMHGSMIAQHSIEDSEFITYEVLHLVITELRNMCSKYLTSGVELLCVCLAASGMISKDGVIIRSPKFSECRGLNLREYFQKEIGTRVLVKNDIQLLLYGEESSIRIDHKTVVMIYIDSGIGGAIALERRILEGEEGFAGEFGLVHFAVGDESIEFDNLSSINAMKRAIRNRAKKGEPCCLGEHFRFKDVVAAFKQGDALVKEVVYNASEYVSKFIYNLSQIINCRFVFIAGRVRQLGEEYLAMIRKNISENYKIEVAYNYLADEAIMTGAISMAINTGIEQIIASR